MNCFSSISTESDRPSYAKIRLTDIDLSDFFVEKNERHQPDRANLFELGEDSTYTGSTYADSAVGGQMDKAISDKTLIRKICVLVHFKMKFIPRNSIRNLLENGRPTTGTAPARFVKDF